MKQIDLVRLNDDWLGVYIDRKLVYQDHTIDPDVLLRKIGVKFNQHQVDDIDAGYLPKRLDKIDALH